MKVAGIEKVKQSVLLKEMKIKELDQVMQELGYASPLGGSSNETMFHRRKLGYIPDISITDAINQPCLLLEFSLLSNYRLNFFYELKVKVFDITEVR